MFSFADIEIIECVAVVVCWCYALGYVCITTTVSSESDQYRLNSLLNGGRKSHYHIAGHIRSNFLYLPS